MKVEASTEIIACKTLHPQPGYLVLRIDVAEGRWKFLEAATSTPNVFAKCIRAAIERIASTIDVPKDATVPDVWRWIEIVVP